MYLSYQKKLNYWTIRYSLCKHNHLTNPYLISYFVHQTWRISHDNAPKLADELQSELFYNKTTRILKNHDQKIEQNQIIILLE